MSIAADITWVEENIKPYIYQLPMLYFVLNMMMWGIIGSFLIFIMRYAAYMASAVESSRMKLNQTVDIEALHAWLATKPITTADLDLDNKSFSKKYSWVEESSSKWNGLPPKVEMLVDERYSYILQVFIQINKRRCKTNALEAKEILFEELDRYKVLDMSGVDVWENSTSRRGHAAAEAAVAAAEAESTAGGDTHRSMDHGGNSRASFESHRNLEEYEDDGSEEGAKSRGSWWQGAGFGSFGSKKSIQDSITPRTATPSHKSFRDSVTPTPRSLQGTPRPHSPQKSASSKVGKSPAGTPSSTKMSMDQIMARKSTKKMGGK
mmetsp:Transcript_24165/g.75894  ORF Transcript_24165/g.75894 Transcript_24165/m.75894 type:complete len:321 (+) Transcript_24165:81-1043(+)